jgi:hypothetical protein
VLTHVTYLEVVYFLPSFLPIFFSGNFSIEK